jgi:hypothetical protein
VTTATAQRSNPRPSAARRHDFKHGRIDIRVHQHIARTGRCSRRCRFDGRWTYTPSVLVMPTRRPCGRQQVGNQPVVVVLLLAGHGMTECGRRPAQTTH